MMIFSTAFYVYFKWISKLMAKFLGIIFELHITEISTQFSVSVCLEYVYRVHFRLVFISSFPTAVARALAFFCLFGFALVTFPYRTHLCIQMHFPCDFCSWFQCFIKSAIHKSIYPTYIYILYIHQKTSAVQL